MAVLGALGDLVLALSADTARFQSDLGRAQRVADKFGREVGRVLGNLAGALIALGGAAGFGALVRGQINAADQAGKMAQKIGVSVEELSSYMIAARLADVSNEQLQTGFQQLAKNQADFVAGTGEAQDAFRALGITQEQIKALNGDTAALFELVAGKLSAFADGANKTAIAMKIFGRSGAELIPLINELEKTRKEAAMFNAIIDADTAAAAERFNDNLTRVGVAVQAFGLHIARAVLPTLEKFSERMVQAAKDMEGMDRAGRIADAALKLIASGGAIVAAVFKVVGANIAATAGALFEASRGNFREAWTILKEGGLDMAKAVTGAITSIGSTWDDAAKDIKAKAPETAKKLAAPGLLSAEMVKKAAAEQRAAIMRVYEDAANAAAADQQIEREAIENRNKAIMAVHEEAQAAAEADAEIEKQRQQGIEEANRLLAETAGELKQNKDFARSLGLTFTSAFEGAVLSGGNFREVLQGIEQDIARIILRKAVTEPLANAIGAGISSLFATNPYTSSNPVDAYQEGTDFVPRTGMALVHKGERIIAAEDNRPGAMGGVTIHQHIQIDSRSDQATIVMAMRQARDEAVAEVQRIQQRRGESRI